MAVTIIGAGPAGCSAALTALGLGAVVTVFEKSNFPRHKVCGEFLSPEVTDLLQHLGVWPECETNRPAVLNSVYLSLGRRTKQWSLSPPARGLSRYAMDHLMLQAAIARGAAFQRSTAQPQPGAVLAYGRHGHAPAGDRIFGFKAHFTGPANDVMGLYFFDRAYVGVNAVEGGVTNICGLAPERLLRDCGFRIDEFLSRSSALRERIAPLTRTMDWLITGPLIFGPTTAAPGCYQAGDSAAFIDPFTGSGMLGAISTGILAGQAAARGSDPHTHRERVHRLVKAQHRAAGLFRAAINSGWAERLLPLVPGRLLFHSTRPKAVHIVH